MPIETQTLKCPNCGAPLNAGPDVAQVTCTYCGSTVRLQRDAQGVPIQADLQSIFTPAQTAPRRKMGISAFLVVGIIVLCIAGFAVGIALLSQSAFRSSPTFAMAMQMAQANPQVVEAFGKPLQPGFFFSGSISTSGNTGKASYQFPISGPLRNGTLQVQGTNSGEGWRVDVWAVYQQDGKDVRIHMTQSP